MLCVVTFGIPRHAINSYLIQPITKYTINLLHKNTYADIQSIWFEVTSTHDY